MLWYICGIVVSFIILIVVYWKHLLETKELDSYLITLSFSAILWPIGLPLWTTYYIISFFREKKNKKESLQKED